MSGPDASLVLRCDCSDLGHLIVFDAWHWDTDKPPFSQLYAHLELETAMPWWRRIGLGARYALTGRTQKWWWTDSVINDASAARLRDFLTEYLAGSLNAASGILTEGGDAKQAPGASLSSPARKGTPRGSRSSTSQEGSN